MHKIPRKYSGFVMGAILSVAMGLIMSLFSTFIALGLVDDFLQRWAMVFLGTLPVGFPVALFVTPVVRAFVDRISE